MLFYLTDGADATQRARVEGQGFSGGLLFTAFCCVVTLRFIYIKSAVNDKLGF